MANLLYLVHRMPYPPNKGDKLRSYHLLRHLAQRHRVFVGTFVDDPEDRRHLGTLRSMCAGLHASSLYPRWQRLKSLRCLLSGEPLTLGYYRNAALREWVRLTALEERIDACVVFSSSMAQYADGLGLPMLVDLVDVDSAKWAQYADRHSWPLSALYRREAVRLLHYERDIALRARRTFLVTARETLLFDSLAPECTGRVEALCNGVDADYYQPADSRLSPFATGEKAVVFTGAMDYWPNVDAVLWFAHDMLPRLRVDWPALRFHVVGRNPVPEVRALAGDGVAVSGTVPDVRPYLQHAAVVVAPMRLARGVQNKVLEAMAMACPVVAASDCVESIGARIGQELLQAADAGGYVAAVDTLLRDPPRAQALGLAARARVLRDFSWGAHLSAIDRHLDAVRPAQPAAALA